MGGLILRNFWLIKPSSQCGIKWIESRLRPMFHKKDKNLTFWGITNWKENVVKYLFWIPSLLAICTMTFPVRMLLKIEIASEWERPWVEWPLTERISSPELKKTKKQATTLVGSTNVFRIKSFIRRTFIETCLL